MPPISLRLGTCLLATALCTAANAQSLALTGIMGDKALIMVDGASPKLFAAGSAIGAARLISVNKAQHQAVVEVQGKASTLSMGASPVSVGGGLSAGGKFINIPMGSNGHFFTDGFVNGHSVKFMVDTGASAIAIGRFDADRLGLDYKNRGTPVQMGTANGVVTGQRITIAQLRIGEVLVHDIEAVIGPNMPFALLGNNFLSRFNMQRNNDMMVLEKTR
ncbi:MAG: TIGR02281 family clan AA aspartic protease [Brachymonas sp.]|jgi:aspartyl protease family protein